MNKSSNQLRDELNQELKNLGVFKKSLPFSMQNVKTTKLLFDDPTPEGSERIAKLQEMIDAKKAEKQTTVAVNRIIESVHTNIDLVVPQQ